MIAEIIMWGFFSAIGWWGAQKVFIENVDPPPQVCVVKKESSCGAKDK